MSGRASDLSRGLPGPLPDGERVLWSGAPSAGSIAQRALHERIAALYFGIIGLGTATFGFVDGRPPGDVAVKVALLALAAVVVCSIIRLFARLIHRTTVYTITNRRVVMRIGIALPITLNVPFAIVGGAGLRAYSDGTGDIPLALTGSGRISFLHLWPHARPWRISRPEPMLRGVPDAREVATILAGAVATFRGEPTPAELGAPERERERSVPALGPAMPQPAI